MDEDLNVGTGTEGTGTSGQVAQEGSKSTGDNQSSRMFTQSELNAIVQDRVKGYKVQIDDLSGKTKTLQDSLNDMTSKFNSLEQSNSLTQLGVSEEFKDFVLFKAEKLAVDGKSLQDAIKEVVGSNKKVLGIEDATGGDTGSTGSENKDSKTGNTSTQGANKDSGNTGDNSGVTKDGKPAQKRSSTEIPRGDGANKGKADSDVDAFLRKKGLLK